MKHALVQLAEEKDEFDPPGSSAPSLNLAAVSCSARTASDRFGRETFGGYFRADLPTASGLPTRASFAICTAANKLKLARIQ